MNHDKSNSFEDQSHLLSSKAELMMQNSKLMALQANKLANKARLLTYHRKQPLHHSLVTANEADSILGDSINNGVSSSSLTNNHGEGGNFGGVINGGKGTEHKIHLEIGIHEESNNNNHQLSRPSISTGVGNGGDITITTGNEGNSLLHDAAGQSVIGHGHHNTVGTNGLSPEHLSVGSHHMSGTNQNSHGKGASVETVGEGHMNQHGGAVIGNHELHGSAGVGNHAHLEGAGIGSHINHESADLGNHGAHGHGHGAQIHIGVKNHHGSEGIHGGLGEGSLEHGSSVGGDVSQSTEATIQIDQGKQIFILIFK